MIVTPTDRSDAIDASVTAAMTAFATRDAGMAAAAADGNPFAEAAMSARLALAPIMEVTIRELARDIVDGLLEVGYVIGRPS